MKVPVAFLADFALAHQDGKFYVTGGFLPDLVADDLPVSLPRLSMGVRVEFDKDEVGKSFLIEIGAMEPGGGEFAKPYRLAYKAAFDEQDPEGRPSLQFVYNMSNLVLRTDGQYTFTVSVNKQQKARVDLRVRLRPSGLTDQPEPEIPEWHEEVQSGYLAFASGRQSEAVSIFTDLVARFPDVPVIRNNLGFVLLENGQAKEALDQFAMAARAHFDRSELLDANIACCEYLLGNYSSAETRFIRCSETRSYLGAQSYLYGLEGSEAFPVELLSAADYVALMDLNAAWAAHASGDDEVAKQHLLRVQPSSLLARHRDLGEQDAFAHSVAVLSKAL